jgi:hypothetical protein
MDRFKDKGTEDTEEKDLRSDDCYQLDKDDPGRSRWRSINDTDDETESMQSDPSSLDTVESPIVKGTKHFDQVCSAERMFVSLHDEEDDILEFRDDCFHAHGKVEEFIRGSSCSSSSSGESEKQHSDKMLHQETFTSYHSEEGQTERVFELCDDDEEADMDVEEADMKVNIRDENMIPNGLFDPESDSESSSSCSTFTNEQIAS